MACGLRQLLLVVAALSTAIALPSSVARAADGWQWPVEPGDVVQPFDPPDQPWLSGHRGLDLAAAVGQEIAAPANGTVTFAGVVAGRGVVVVSHGELRSTLEPVIGTAAVGATVQAGDRVGVLQGFGHHCLRPCLHWGVRRGDTYLDPRAFVEPPPSRLLPVWAGSGATSSASGIEPRGAVDAAAWAPRSAAADGGAPPPVGHSHATIGSQPAQTSPPSAPSAPSPPSAPSGTNGDPVPPSRGATAPLIVAVSGGLLVLAGWRRLTASPR